MESSPSSYNWRKEKRITGGRHLCKMSTGNFSLLFILICFLYLCMCKYVCVCACTLMPEVHASCLPLLLSTLVLRGLSPSPELNNWAKLAGQCTLDMCQSHSNPNTRVADTYRHAWFLSGCCGSKLKSSCLRGRHYLPIKPSFQSYFLLVFGCLVSC